MLSLLFEFKLYTTADPLLIGFYFLETGGEVVLHLYVGHLQILLKLFHFGVKARLGLCEVEVYVGVGNLCDWIDGQTEGATKYEYFPQF